MRRNLLIALAGMMMFAFTQCGGGGSKEFKDFEKAINEFESQIKKAKSCDDIIEAEMALDDCDWVNNDYSDDEQMTESEREKADEIMKRVLKVYEEQEENLCSDYEDQFNRYFDDFDGALDDWGDDIDNALDDWSRDIDDAWDDIEDDLDDASDDWEDAFEEFDDLFD